MRKPFIDAHVHLNTSSIKKMEKAVEYGVSFLSINTDIPFFIPLDQQRQTVIELQKKYPGKVQFITSFSVKNWEDDDWSDRAIAEIESGLKAGAVGVKIWKNIGMELLDQYGTFVMVDHPKFDPLFNYFEKNNILVLGHLGEPKNCWLPLEKMTVESDRKYFKEHPEYHMFLHPLYPSYDQQLLSRDNRLNKHPKLKFVGLHLASMEWSVKKVADWLDTYPFTMTDVAERISHLQYQTQHNRDGVRDFFIRYQDRIIYGTDVIDDGILSAVEVATRLEQLWLYHWDFFSSQKIMKATEFNGSFKGLKLPCEVLEKIFYKNALRTYGFR